jgi:hypothetical protein
MNLAELNFDGDGVADGGGSDGFSLITIEMTNF